MSSLEDGWKRSKERLGIGPTEEDEQRFIDRLREALSMANKIKTDVDKILEGDEDGEKGPGGRDQ